MMRYKFVFELLDEGQTPAPDQFQLNVDYKQLKLDLPDEYTTPDLRWAAAEVLIAHLAPGKVVHRHHIHQYTVGLPHN